MNEKLPQEILDNLNNFAVDLSLIESLSRILFDEIRFNDNSEKFDVENLSNILKQRIIELINNFKTIHHELEFGFNIDSDSLSSPSKAS